MPSSGRAPGSLALSSAVSPATLPGRTARDDPSPFPPPPPPPGPLGARVAFYFFKKKMGGGWQGDRGATLPSV